MLVDWPENSAIRDGNVCLTFKTISFNWSWLHNSDYIISFSAINAVFGRIKKEAIQMKLPLLTHKLLTRIS